MLTETLGAIARLQTELNKLPGIGPKSAERIAHHLMAESRDEVLALAQALRDIKDKIHPCRQCFFLTEEDLCQYCSDPRRDASVLCVVEQPRDLMSLERAGTYRGLYHVLQGRLAPLDNMGPENLTLEALVTRVHESRQRDCEIREIILATNPTIEGDGTALYISNLLAGSGARITRLARGIPSGSVLEFANTQMLADALAGRQTF